MGDKPQQGRNEIQKLVCTLSSGSFQLTYKYAITSSIDHSATALQVRDTLEELYPLQFVDVSFSPDNGRVCSAAGETTFIEFTHDFGDVPLMTSNSGSVIVSESRKGSRVSYGLDVTKVATWDADQMRACLCDGYPDYNQTFSTGDRGKYAGPACQFRTCPTGPDPMGAIPIRYRITCLGDGGTVRLTFSGSTSAALGPGTTSSDLATALQAMDNVEGVTATDMPQGTLCAVPGGAVSQVWLTTRIEDHAVVDLAVADAAITASAGTPSVTVARVSSVLGNENQTVTCAADGGSFTIDFQGHVTAPIAAAADEAAFQAALQDLPSIGRVTISMGGVAPKSVCRASGISTVVTFSTQLGDISTMSVDGSMLTLASGTASITVVETDKGTTTPIECSGRGFCGEPSAALPRYARGLLCPHQTNNLRAAPCARWSRSLFADTTLGSCQCLAGYVSGDGQGYYGQRGDCGTVDPLFANTHPIEWAIANLR